MCSTPSAPKQLTAAGSLSPSNTTARITVGLVLTAGGGDATATIREGGVSGTVVLSMATLAGTQTDPVFITVAQPYLSAIAGAGAALTVLQ